MRIARQAFVSAIVAFALTAGPAIAVEVAREDTAEHCPAVTTPQHGSGSGGCVVRVVSTSTVEFGGPLGMILCDRQDYEARIDESGGGFAYVKSWTGCSPSSQEPCAEGSSGQDPWPVRFVSTTQMELSYCVVINGLFEMTCHLANVDVDQISHSQVDLSTSGHQNCEPPSTSVAANWTLASDAAHPDILVSP